MDDEFLLSPSKNRKEKAGFYGTLLSDHNRLIVPRGYAMGLIVPLVGGPVIGITSGSSVSVSF